MSGQGVVAMRLVLTVVCESVSWSEVEQHWVKSSRLTPDFPNATTHLPGIPGGTLSRCHVSSGISTSVVVGTTTRSVCMCMLCICSCFSCFCFSLRFTADKGEFGCCFISASFSSIPLVFGSGLGPSEGGAVCCWIRAPKPEPEPEPKPEPRVGL